MLYNKMLRFLDDTHGFSIANNTGLGFKNVRDRILLCFGMEYGLKINSHAGRGTYVSVEIPLMEQ